MPVFLAALLGGLINIAGTLAGRVLLSLGMSVVTITGVSATLAWARSNVVSSFAGMPGQIVGMLSAMGLGSFLSIVISAITTRMLLQGLTGDAIKKWVTK
ncbi:DUF2523 domain-containing protein [Paracidovorax anthurii]|uniref:Uncharacterized protein DUF2523 n=1 Tax=Paracidovorax anthurii TaxID=78229 RepID=A0A328ZDQ9_9BURK|nr:DUF2523 domain-containing protein [Paracidovorax anthurii]RAR83533.1 uncharacterized protein DUF2523 [Paracidovorax anthurii]